MGKQTTYYMSCDEFLTLAQAALDEGCSLLRWEDAPEPPRPFRDLSAIDLTHPNWYFLLPDAGELRFRRNRFGEYYLDTGGAMETQLIETGFSVQSKRGLWGCARLYIPSSALVKGELIPRPEEATRIYDKLARLVRRLCPMRTYTLDNGSPMKLRVSAAIAEKAGPDGAALGAVHERNHPLTAEEQLALLRELTAPVECSRIPQDMQLMADSLHKALTGALQKEESPCSGN